MTIERKKCHVVARTKVSAHSSLGQLGRALIGCVGAAALVTALLPNTARAATFSDVEMDAITEHVYRGGSSSNLHSCGSGCQAFWQAERGVNTVERLHRQLLTLRTRTTVLPSFEDMGKIDLASGAANRALRVYGNGGKVITFEVPPKAVATTGCYANCPQRVFGVGEGENLASGGTAIPAPADGLHWYWRTSSGSWAWRRLVPGPEPNCNNHPAVPGGFQTFTGAQSSWCYAGRDHQVGFLDGEDVRIPSAIADYTGQTTNAVTPGGQDPSFSTLKATIETQFNSGELQYLMRWYRFQVSGGCSPDQPLCPVPPCRTMTVTQCEAALEDAGFMGHSVAPTPAVDFYVAPDHVVATSPSEGQIANNNIEVLIYKNPDPTGWETALVDAFRPQLLYDQDEAFAAASAAMMTDHVGPDPPGTANVLNRDLGPSVAPPTLSLGFLALGSYPDSVVGSTADSINARPDEVVGLDDEEIHSLTNAEMRGNGYGDTIYGRVRQTGNETWIQYWIFYYYNPAPPQSVGAFSSHEGDWETVQLRFTTNPGGGLLGDAGPLGPEPVDVAAQAHDQGSTCPWDDVQHDPVGFPQIYVGQDSHASFFGPKEPGPLTTDDIARGNGDHSRPDAVRVTGSESWLQWSGRWGGTPGGLGGFPESPPGPSQQGSKWNEPNAWAAGLTSGGGECGAGSSARLAAPTTETRASVAEVGDHLVEVVFETQRGDGPRPLGLRIIAERDGQRTLGFADFSSGAYGGTETIPAPPGAGPVTVVLIPYDKFRRPLERRVVSSRSAASDGGSR